MRASGCASPEVDARLLVCAACGLDHAGLIREPDARLGERASLLAAYARRRLDGEPVSRILGTREFWGLPFAIDGSVLDPRPETEGLVGAVLDAIGGRSPAALSVLDLGTGSGALLCALLTELPHACGIGVDRSPAACRVAARNVAALGLTRRATVVCGSWADALRASFDVVVANPPYIPAADVAGLSREVRDHDPHAALAGGADGLEAYRAICPDVPRLVRAGGTIAFECGWDQGEAVAALMLAAGLCCVTVLKDLAGHQRVVTAAAPGRDGA